MGGVGWSSEPSAGTTGGGHSAAYSSMQENVTSGNAGSVNAGEAKKRIKFGLN